MIVLMAKVYLSILLRSNYVQFVGVLNGCYFSHQFISLYFNLYLLKYENITLPFIKFQSYLIQENITKKQSK